MKKNVLVLICFSALLVACDAGTISNPATSDSGNSNADADTSADASGDSSSADVGSDGTGGTTGTDTGTNEIDGTTTPNAGNSGTTGTGLDGITTSRTATGLVNSVGLIKLEPVGISTDSSRGLFGNLPTTLTEQQIRDWYIPPTDSCIVTILSEDTGPEPAFQVVDQSANLVSAGESLILSDDNGTYASLQRTDRQTGPVYLPEVDLEQRAGLNLSVAIPGEEFSAFTNIAVPPVPELRLVTPGDNENVDVATFFQWEPNNTPGSVVELYTSGISSVSNEAIFIGCSLVDDGLYSFSEELQAAMGPDYDDDWTTLLRVSYNVAAEGDTLVFIANSVRAGEPAN